MVHADALDDAIKKIDKLENFTKQQLGELKVGLNTLKDSLIDLNKNVAQQKAKLVEPVKALEKAKADIIKVQAMLKKKKEISDSIKNPLLMSFELQLKLFDNLNSATKKVEELLATANVNSEKAKRDTLYVIKDIKELDAYLAEKYFSKSRQVIRDLEKIRDFFKKGKI